MSETTSDGRYGRCERSKAQGARHAQRPKVDSPVSTCIKAGTTRDRATYES